ncbi:MAG: hypothetical protein O2975_00140 [Proteobacteria bacterium]|nr:hypothetical protein [Pseudomonadota bacterium]
MVTAIVGLLLGSLTYTLSAQVEQRNRSETDRRLAEARELLLGFAIARGRLPCPSTVASAGDEAPVGGGICTTNYAGFLPAKAIGFQPTDAAGFAVDAWGNRIRYAVSATNWSAGAGRFTTAHTTSAWSLTQAPADLVVCTQTPTPITNTSCNAGTSVTNTSTVLALVFSTGKNTATGGTGANEVENLEGDPLFVYRPPDPVSAAGGEYDDQMVWIPVGLLYGRMVSAGILP